MFLGIFLNKPKLIVTKFTNSSSFGTIFRLFPVFLPDFSKRAHYRVTRFTLFLVELHKAERLFVGCLLNRLIPPPPTAVPRRTGARPLCRCATSPRTAGSHPLQGRLIGYIFFAPPLAKGESGAAAGGCTVRIRKKTAPVRRQALFGMEHYYFFGTRRSVPPIYGCKALGTSTLPSACKLFSRKAMSILGGATTVLFRVWAR